MRNALSTALRGAGAGVGAGVVQVMVGKAEDELLLPPGENADIAPRFAHRVAVEAGHDLSETGKWALGTAFHFGYSAAWGVLYALAAERRPIPPVLGGVAIGAVIYGLTFPSWGVAVLSGTERSPQRRSARMTFVAASVATAFGVATTLLYDRIRTHPAARDV